MNSRERVLAAIGHGEPDRVPFDAGGMAQSGFHRIAYGNLRDYLGLEKKPVRLLNIITQAARMDEDLMDALGTDCRIAYGKWADPEGAVIKQEGDYLTFENEWAVGFRMPAQNGLYFDICAHPLSGEDYTEKLEKYIFPDPALDERFDTLSREIKTAADKNKLVVLMGMCPGIFEVGTWLRGFEGFFEDMVLEPERIQRLLDTLSEIKARYWEKALRIVGQHVDVINEVDDMASQTALMFSPDMYRRLIKPYHQKIFERAKKAAPHVKILFHSCGAVAQLIPDLIDAGIDILNPVQYTAKGMELSVLKKTFGKDITFWGGGIDTQNVLVYGNEQQIKDEVKRNIDILAPGGGFVFSAVHIIQPNVHPRNIMAMVEALREYA